jgi:hypothetical protein
MIDEILNDFFSYVSRDKKLITSGDLRKMELNLDRQDFKDILQNLEEFLNEFVYWSIRKLNISIVDNQEINMNKIVYK